MGSQVLDFSKFECIGTTKVNVIHSNRSKEVRNEYSGKKKKQWEKKKERSSQQQISSQRITNLHRSSYVKNLLLDP